MGHENSKVREIPNQGTRNSGNYGQLHSINIDGSANSGGGHIYSSTPVTVANAPTQIDIQTNPRRSLFAFDDIYCTWFCFSLFTDGFANWRLVWNIFWVTIFGDGFW